MGKTIAVILAAGKGRRMSSNIAKQYIKVEDKPIIYYSLMAFEKSNVDEIVLVVSRGEEDYVRESIVKSYGFTKVTHIVAGGRERYNSVYNGLKSIEYAEYVLIHDGARPMISQDIISRVLVEVKKTGACIAGIPSKDTIKILDNDRLVVNTPDRSLVWNIQTPQAFKYELIYEAYKKLLEDCCITMIDAQQLVVTDDAMVLETMTGHRVKVVEGGYENIKLTTDDDLLILNELIKKNPS